jgi:hypothetical protein
VVVDGMLAAYLVCAAVRPDPSLVDDNSTVVILDEGASQKHLQQREEEGLSGTEHAELLVIPLIVMAVEADLVIHHSRKYLQMLALTERKLVIACGQGELTTGMLPEMESLPDGLVGRFDTIVALRSSDDAAIKEACTFLRSIFAGDDASAEDRPATT